MKKRYFIVISLVFLLSCQNKEARKDRKEESINNVQKVLDSSIVIIDNIKYKVYLSLDKDLFVLNEKNDTIYKHPKRATNGFEITDYNEDGYKDILINQISNVGGLHELVFYEKKSGQFIAVENFTEFPSSEKIQGTKYYYSFHRSGCADANWDSDLFYIENYKAIKIGNISGRECETEEHKRIFINKVIGGKEILKETVSVDEKKQLDKWDLIKKYWIANYKNFE